MKICFLGLGNLPVLARQYNGFGIGGEEVQHTLLAKALTRLGHQVSMVVYDHGQDDGARWDGIATFKAYAAHGGLPVTRYIHPRWTGVWSALRRADADVYYVSCAGMHLGLLALFCKKYGKRCVFRVAHDRDCEPDHLLIRYWRDKKLYEYGLRHCHTVLVQSERQRQAMLRNYGLDSIVAEMPVEAPGAVAPFGARDIDVLWVNNIRQFKRPDLYIELARSMPALAFHMVGGPQPGLADMYGQVAAAAAQVPNLIFHGRVPYHDVGTLYGRAKVFVNTSDSEGFPNSFLQSWIRGTPVVSFFDPDGTIAGQGLGRAPASLDEMRQAIGELLGDAAHFERLGARCRAFMDARYGEANILAPYLRVFEQEAA